MVDKMDKEKPYCLKCAGEKVNEYSIDLCEKHYNEQFNEEESEELVAASHTDKDTDEKLKNMEF